MFRIEKVCMIMKIFRALQYTIKKLYPKNLRGGADSRPPPLSPGTDRAGSKLKNESYIVLDTLERKVIQYVIFFIAESTL